MENAGSIKLLANVLNLTAKADASRPAKSAADVLPGCKVYVPLAEHIDLEAEAGKQAKKLVDLEKRLAGISAKLGNAGFVAKAPADVVAQQRELEADLARQIHAVQSILAELKS
jgi:valyl-tRNA synthetase